MNTGNILKNIKQLTKMKSIFTTTNILIGAVLFTAGCALSKEEEVADVLLQSTQNQYDARKLNSTSFKTGLTTTQQRTLLEKAVQKDPFFGPAHNNLGIILYQQNELHHAAEHFNKAASLLSQNPAPLTNLAILHAKLCRWDAALKHAQKAYHRDPHNTHTLKILALAMSRNSPEFVEFDQILDKLLAKNITNKWRKWAVNQKILNKEDT